MAQVELESIYKVFGTDVEAVKDFTLYVQDREFVVLVGPSGCGKSTTLRMIAGLEEITEGTIKIDDRIVNDVQSKDRNIAMVFQDYALYPHMTVYENMGFGLKLRKFPKVEIDERVREAARILGLEELLERRPRALSGGQRQRVAVGRAIVRDPAVFLFDEPLSNLDAKLRAKMRVELKRLHHRLDATMVYVTHDQVEAMTMGDRIVVMRDGLIQQCDTPTAIYDEPANRYVAGFIGTPSMNFFDGTVGRENGSLVFREGDFQVELPDEWEEPLRSLSGAEVCLGVRPEDLYHGGSPGTEYMPRLQAPVDVVEPMGSEAYLYLKTGRHEFIAEVDGHTPVEAGQSVDLAMDMRRVHFFDPETEEALI